MDTGQARWLDEPSGTDAPPSGSPVPASGLRPAVPRRAAGSEPAPTSRRSQVETLPCPPGTIEAIEVIDAIDSIAARRADDAPDAQDAPGEASPPASERERQRLMWCIDFGASMRTMSTFELWTAIERGEVRADLRVWREGMERWLPVDEVPSLAVALVAMAPLVTPSPSPAAATTGPAPEVARTPAPPPHPAQRTERARPAHAPPPASRAAALDPGEARLGPLGRGPPRSGHALDRPRIGVAAGAITAALTLGGKPPAPPSQAIPASPAPTQVAAAKTARPFEARLASPPAASEPEAAPAEPTRAHHDEAGQHRLRRGQKQARAR
ncbi:MAG: DUF4339 domain-containing protein [Byssovorax sp.]